MTDPKTDPQEDRLKKPASLEVEHHDEVDVDPDEEFHGLDDAVEAAEKAWGQRSAAAKSGLSEEQQLAELFGLVSPAATVVENPTSEDEKQSPGEPMRGPHGDVAPAHQWSINARDVLGPTGDGDNQEPHQEYFKDFGVHINGREINLPGTAGPVLRLGRNPLASDLSFTDGYVSREHASITTRDGKAFITNLQKSNDTYLIRNGATIKVSDSPAATELLPGDTIRLGRYTEMQWLRSTDMKTLGKPRLYAPKPGEADPAAGEVARRESNQYLRNHEYSKPFPDGFQNVSGSNQIDADGKHNDKERPSVIVDQRPGADPALEQFVKEMKAKYSHLAGDPRALAEALAREAKTALEPKGWSNAAVDDGYFKLRSDYAGKRMLLGDFLEAAKYSKGAGVCNHQAMLTKVAFDNFYPADLPNRPEMKMVRGYYGENPAGLPADMVMNHAWNTLTVPNKDGSKGRELIVDPRNMIYGDAMLAQPNYHSGKDIPQMRPKDMVPKALDLKENPLTPSEVERLRGEEVRYGTRGWRIKDIDGKLAQISSNALKNAEEHDFAAANPEAARSGKWVVGQEYNVKRSSGEIEKGWQLTGIAEVDGKKIFVLGKQDGLVRRVLLEDLQRQNPEVFEEVGKERAAKLKAAEVPAVIPSNPESHGFVPGREITHQGQQWVVLGQNGKDIEIARGAIKFLPPERFQELNGNEQPKIGNDYLVRRSSGEVEKWKLTGINPDTGELALRSPTAFREKVSLERLAEQNRSIIGPLDVGKVLADPRSKVNLICRWTDGESSHDKWIGEVEGANGERISVMVHKPPHGDQKDWVRLRNDLAAQELAKAMGAPELFPPTVIKDGMMVQAFVGEKGENIANFLHNRSRQDKELRAQEPDLEKRIEKLLAKDPALKARVAEGVAFSVLLGDHDQHGLNFVINRDGAGPNDFHVARIDTDYAFSRDKRPNMDQAGNFGSVINGAFAHLSGQELPADVRAKIKNVSDQLSTPAGRAAFQKATNLPMDRVEALAERAKTMSESGRFPVSKTMAQQRAEYGMGSPREGRAREIGDVIEAQKIGTVASHSGNDLKAIVDRLKAERPILEEKLRSQKGPEKYIYKDMVENLEKLKKSGKIDSGWELFPTEALSPADSAGCDVLMLNTKTGKFEMLDFTADPNKVSTDANVRRREKVSEIRRDGVILFDPRTYDTPDFKQEVADQMQRLANREQLLQMGPPKECPFPEMFEKKNLGTKKAELDGFIDWAKKQADSYGRNTPEGRLMANLADVVNDASVQAQKKLAEQATASKSGKKFEEKVRETVKQEIVDKALAAVTGEQQKPIAGTGTVKSSVKQIQDQLKLTVSSDEIHSTGNMTDILSQSRTQLMDVKAILSVIENRSKLIGRVLEPRKIENIIDRMVTPPKGETSQARALRIEAIKKDIESPKTAYPGVRKEAMTQVAKAVLEKIIDQRDLTEVDGRGKRAQRDQKERPGSGREENIVDRVITRLQGKSDDQLLDREEKVEAPATVKPADLPKTKVPEPTYSDILQGKGEELFQEYVAEKGDLTKLGEQKELKVDLIMEWMLELQQENKTWTDAELASFKKLAEAYKQADPAAVAEVHKRLNASIDSATGGTVRTGVIEDGPKRPKRGSAPSADRISGVQQHSAEDGTITRGREVVGRSVPGERLSEGELLAKNEVEGLKKDRLALEQKEKDHKISEEEKVRLEALRYAEKNIADPAFQRELKGRARRGMAAGEISGTLSGVAILTSAALGYYLSMKKQETYEAPSRSRVGDQ